MNEQQRERLAHFLAHLDRPGLLEARDMIEALLDEAADSQPAGGNGGRGWVELKTINGCGPYAYRRWRQGGRLRSEYIGKVKV